MSIELFQARDLEEALHELGPIWPGREFTPSEMRWIEQTSAQNPPTTASRQHFLQALQAYARGDDEAAAHQFGQMAVTGSDLHERSLGLVNAGAGLFRQQKWEEAMACYEKVIWQIDQASDPDLDYLVLRASLDIATIHNQLERPQQELSCLDVIVKRFGGDERNRFDYAVSEVMHNKGAKLAVLGRTDEALDCFENLLPRYGSSSDPANHVQIARAWHAKRALFDKRQQPERALACCEAIIHRFGSTPELALQHHVAAAFYEKAFLQVREQRPQEAEATFDTLIRRYGESERIELRNEWLGPALLSKAALLDEQERHVDEIACYDQIIGQLGPLDAQDTAIRGYVADARDRKSVV
mgnify:FL=1